jgi:hypothetical protein
MYIIVRNIFRFFPSLMNPQREDKYDCGDWNMPSDHVAA